MRRIDYVYEWDKGWIRLRIRFFGSACQVYDEIRLYYTPQRHD